MTAVINFIWVFDNLQLNLVHNVLKITHYRILMHYHQTILGQI